MLACIIVNLSRSVHPRCHEVFPPFGAVQPLQEPFPVLATMISKNPYISPERLIKTKGNTKGKTYQKTKGKTKGEVKGATQFKLAFFHLTKSD